MYTYLHSKPFVIVALIVSFPSQLHFSNGLHSHQPTFPGNEMNFLCFCILNVLGLAALFDNLFISQTELKTILCVPLPSVWKKISR